MALNAELLRSSAELVVSREPDFTLRFYGILFKRYPQLQPLFGRNSRDNQAKMLRDSIVAVLDHLEDAPWLVTNLKALGDRHKGYQVTPEMYPMVGECLLATLAEIAGDDWSPEIQAAWSDAYGAIVSMMEP